ncbi:MAG: hypothetical protein KC621_07725, partial [Myxococcales bacterium]|nr:hypothetical protein [Myxococcales bacterium]
MSGDPYIRAWRTEQARRLRTEGWVGLVRGVLLPAAAAVVLVPLVRRTFLVFLGAPDDVVALGLTEVVFRADIVVLSIVMLDLYERIVRGRDRQVLEIWPVRPEGVVRAAMVASLASRVGLMLAGAVVLSPVLLEAGPAPWLACLGSLLCTLLLGTTAGGAGHLLAVHVARSDRLGPVLDLVRGNNPRAQAAFIYAPGMVLLVVGLLLRLSAMGVGLVPTDPIVGGLLVAAPLPGALLAWPAVAPLARSAWFQASAVLSEIDARYATHEDPEEARRVYLEWLVRFVPEQVRLYALDDLRHGWRARPTLIAVGGLLALLGIAAAWTTDPAGPWRAAVVAVGAGFAVAANGVLLDVDEPELMRVWLPRHAVHAT